MDIRCGVVILVLVSSLQLILCQELTGCGGTKGCYKHPSDCTGDDCIAFVTWENADNGRTRFALRAAPSETVAWVALGLRRQSESFGMVPADVYVCTSSGTAVERTENILTPDNRWNSVTRVIPENSVETESISYTDNVISCVFTRNASLADASDPMFYDISGTNAYYLLLAVGNELNENRTIDGKKHFDYRATPVALTLQSVFEVPPEPELYKCGETRGCFRQPPDCTGDNCVAYVTWENTADGKMQFAMRASMESADDLKWVAFGLRPETVTSGMSPAEVYACTSNSEIRRSRNVRSYDSTNQDMPLNTVDQLLATYVTGFSTVIKCVFTRTLSLAGDDTFYDISGDNAYYLLLAIGNDLNTAAPVGSIQGKKHTQRYAASSAMKLQSEFTMPTMEPPTGGELVGCGETKGCFRFPDSCTGTNCDAYVTWQLQQDGQFRFVMRGQAPGWVAFGLQRSTVTSGMSPAEVYACTSDGEVKRSENVNPYNSEARTIPDSTVTVEYVRSENNVIECTFTRQPYLQGDDTFYNISGNLYYILLAVSNSLNPDGTIQRTGHSNRLASAETFDLTEFGVGSGEDEAPLAKAHASLMMIAWIGFASIGITLARFFKPLWPDSKLLGQKVWFTIHRACMMTCVLCFCSAFILIFVKVKGFVNTGSAVTVAHAICGIIVTFLGLVNPIMAIFRPHPGTPKRPIFNWAHWSVGTLAHMLGLVTIFLGIGYSSSLLGGLPSYTFFIMLAFVLFHAVMWILLEVVGRMSESKGSNYNPSNDDPQAIAVISVLPHGPDMGPNPDEPGRSNDVPLKKTGGDSSQELDRNETEPPPEEDRESLSQITDEGASGKMILLAIYILGMLALLITLVVLVCVA